MPNACAICGNSCGQWERCYRHKGTATATGPAKGPSVASGDQSYEIGIAADSVPCPLCGVAAGVACNIWFDQADAIIDWSRIVAVRRMDGRGVAEMHRARL